MASTTRGRKRIVFSIHAPAAREVYLVGDFNDWDESAHPMTRQAGGIWRKILMLAPGRYEYKFRVGQDWACDPDNDQDCENAFGTRNSVIEVAPDS